MELIIAGIFVLVVASLLVFRKKSEPQETVASVPYKVETTTPAPEVAPVVAEVAPVVAEVVVEVAPVQAEVVEAPAKKTRKPRTPKAQLAVKEKVPAKAKAPKTTAKKPAARTVKKK